MRERRSRARACRLAVSGAAALGLLCIDALAQTAEPVANADLLAPPRAAAMPIVLQADRADSKLRLSLSPEQRPFVECMGACSLYLAPDAYWVEVRGRGVIEGERKFQIDGASLVRVHPRTQTGRRTGLALGILGIVLIAAGSGTYLAVDSRHDTSESSVALLGVAAALAGVVLTPVGWVKYSRSSPTVEVLARE